MSFQYLNSKFVAKEIKITLLLYVLSTPVPIRKHHRVGRKDGDGEQRATGGTSTKSDKRLRERWCLHANSEAKMKYLEWYVLSVPLSAGWGAVRCCLRCSSRLGRVLLLLRGAGVAACLLQRDVSEARYRPCRTTLLFLYFAPGAQSDARLLHVARRLQS